MKLIEIDTGRIASYLSNDTSSEAIDAFVRKSGGKKWRTITEAEATSIRCARPRAITSPQKAVAAVDTDAVGTMLQQLQPPEKDSAGKLALAVALANYAIQAGVHAGDYRWHGGNTDFEWNGMRFDAPDLIEYAQSLL